MGRPVQENPSHPCAGHARASSGPCTVPGPDIRFRPAGHCTLSGTRNLSAGKADFFGPTQVTAFSAAQVQTHAGPGIDD